MTTTTLTKNPRTLVAAGTSNAAGAATRGTLDLRTAHGGLVTLKITNGGTGPTVSCKGRVLVAHNSGTTPTAAAAGADWKTIWEMDGGVSNSLVTERAFPVHMGAMHIEVEFTGNTGSAVTVEAYMSEVTSVATA